MNWVVKNKGKDQLATRVEFAGDLKEPDINTWYIIGQMLRNGFIQALYPALENSVNINSVDKVTDSKLKTGYESAKGPGAAKEEKKSKREIRKEKKAERKEEKEKENEKKKGTDDKKG